MLVRVAILTVLLAMLASPADARIARVWAVDDGHKIRLDEPPPPDAGTEVSLFGMRNETLAFQVVVESDSQGDSQVELSIRGLGAVEVEVFREDYVQVAERSRGLVWKPGSAAEPKGLLGPIPDRLVPMSVAGDVTLAPNARRVFWIDIWIPPGAPAGESRGTLVVSSKNGCETPCEIPVRVELLDRDMPDDVRARSMVWFSASESGDERVAARYFSNPASATESQRSALRMAHYHLARKHRISLIGQHDDIDSELDSLLSGRAFSEATGYRGPGQGRGLDVLALHAYGGELETQHAMRLLERAQSYPDVRDAFVYIMDEPDKTQFAEINRRARASRPMPSLVTTPFTKELDVDIFSVLASMYSRKNASQGKAAGKTLWIYNGERPFTGSFAIDDVAVAPRVNPWIQYKLDIPRWFYWEATYYYDFQGKRGAVDVGRNALNFTNRHGDRVNGDGLLMYPGRDLLFPESDVGVDGPLPSIRLKNWRRGIEDVEYLVMARKAGFDAEVDALLETLLPRIVDQVDSSDAVHFAEDAGEWRKARRLLFELLRDGRSDVQVNAVPEFAEPRRLPWWIWAVAGAALAAIATAVVRRRS